MKIHKLTRMLIGSRIPKGTSGSVLFIDADGKLGQNNANLFWDDTNKRVGLGTITSRSILDVIGGSGNSRGLTLTSSNTDATTKVGLISMGHFTNAEEVVTLMATLSNGTNNVLFFGGGTGANAATKLQFFTAANDTTLIGTQRLEINSDGHMVFPKASDRGIKVDLTTPTFGFADLLGDQFTRNTGATKPTLATYNGAVKKFQFGNGEEAYLTYHIGHDHVKGTDIFIHIHWSQTSTTATGGTLDFKYFAIYSKGHNQATGSTFTSTPITATFSTIDINDGSSGLNQYQQHLTEVIISGASATAALFDRDDLEPDGVIELTFEMDANNLTNSVTVLDPFIHYVDIHYQTTGLIGTKAKAPNFYV